MLTQDNDLINRRCVIKSVNSCCDLSQCWQSANMEITLCGLNRTSKPAKNHHPYAPVGEQKLIWHKNMNISPTQPTKNHRYHCSEMKTHMTHHDTDNDHLWNIWPSKTVKQTSCHIMDSPSVKNDQKPLNNKNSIWTQNTCILVTVKETLRNISSPNMGAAHIMLPLWLECQSLLTIY